ncbi:hypothetical protein QFZ75_000014 [Streptomyces sp. V3I8]|nr:hypothetical protein [Streptomyces sp. V3I8]
MTAARAVLIILAAAAIVAATITMILGHRS